MIFNARMRDHEVRPGMRFDIMVLHDAEDVIHPDSLRLNNFFSREYGMVQIPYPAARVILNGVHAGAVW